MHLSLSIGLLALGPWSFAGNGDGTFQAPIELPTPDNRRPLFTTMGTFNGDNTVDLATADGSNLITLFFQGPTDRNRWTQVLFPISGRIVTYLFSADFDSRDCDDLAIADDASQVRIFRCNADGTFAEWAVLPDDLVPGGMAAGHFNNDEHRDLAVSVPGSAQILVYLNDGKGQFTRAGNPLPAVATRLEAVDWSGDALPDLIAMTDRGVRLFLGIGDGLFNPAGEPVSNLGCLSDFATGDLNRDGRIDLAGLCNGGQGSRGLTVGLSRGDGTYQKTFELELPVAKGPLLIADLDGDGLEDVALTQASKLQVFRGNGDGDFLPAVAFGPIEGGPYLARDLDSDHHQDLVSAGQGLSVVWGREGKQFLEAGFPIPELSGTHGMAIADLDRNGSPELFVPPPEGPGIQVYRYDQPGPVDFMDTGVEYQSLESVDLDGDGVLDLVGTNRSLDAVLVALLDRGGNVRRQSALFAHSIPVGAMVAAGRINEDGEMDLAVPSTPFTIAIFLGLGGGDFGPGMLLDTARPPSQIALTDLDGDSRTDLVAVSSSGLAIHWGRGGGHFSGPELVDTGIGSVALGIDDLNADGIPDLAILQSYPNTTGLSKVRIFQGNGKGFEARDTLFLSTNFASSLVLADLDGNGLPDVTVGNESLFSVFLNLGTPGFDYRVDYQTGFGIIGHRFADLDLDGSLDLVAFGQSNVLLLFGSRTSPVVLNNFQRGDVDRNGVLDISDAIRVLARLFLGTAPLSCEDAADVDDNGTLELTDPIFLLVRLFVFGPPPPPPVNCGKDPTPDGLAPCGAARC